MSFVLGRMLWLLALMPLLVVGYVALDRRHVARAAALAAQGFKPNASAAGMRREGQVRRIPALCFGAAIIAMLVAVARPTMHLTTSQPEGTVVMVFDVSNSMRATDVLPSRLDAAKSAARSFVVGHRRRMKIGVVAFTDGGVLVQRPTSEMSSVLAAINRLRPRGATSLGQGMFTALSAIAGGPLGIDPSSLGGETASIAYLGPATMLLFSDGENTSRPDPLDVAKLASVAGVRIYAIGTGMATDVLDIDGYRVSTTFDGAALDAIAKVANGASFGVNDKAGLASIDRSIGLRLRAQTKVREMTDLLAGVSAVLLGIGSALSIRWHGRLV